NEESGAARAETTNVRIIGNVVEGFHSIRFSNSNGLDKILVTGNSLKGSMTFENAGTILIQGNLYDFNHAHAPAVASTNAPGPAIPAGATITFSYNTFHNCPSVCSIVDLTHWTNGRVRGLRFRDNVIGVDPA